MSMWLIVAFIAYLLGAALEYSQFLRCFRKLVEAAEKKLLSEAIDIDPNTRREIAKTVVVISCIFSSLLWPYSLLTGQTFDEKDLG